MNYDTLRVVDYKRSLANLTWPCDTCCSAWRHTGRSGAVGGVPGVMGGGAHGTDPTGTPWYCSGSPPGPFSMKFIRKSWKIMKFHRFSSFKPDFISHSFKDHFVSFVISLKPRLLKNMKNTVYSVFNPLLFPNGSSKSVFSLFFRVYPCLFTRQRAGVLTKLWFTEKPWKTPKITVFTVFTHFLKKCTFYPTPWGRCLKTDSSRWVINGSKLTKRSNLKVIPGGLLRKWRKSLKFRVF